MSLPVFGVVGGDRRQIYLARSIAQDGYPVYVSCLERSSEAHGLLALPLSDLCRRCDIFILPLPATRDGRTLSAPLSEEEVILDDAFAEGFSCKRVFGGVTQKLCASSPLWENISCRDYYDREELTVGNAFLTAEGALGVVISEYEGAIGGSRVLVTGFGRIGKALCLYLKGLGAEVDCCARKARDMSFIRALGCRALTYGEISGDYDIIFNTVPAQVLGARELSAQRGDTLLVELASKPGGIDIEAAERLGLRVRELPSLPGKMSPKAAGEAVKQTVYNMLEEESGVCV